MLPELGDASTAPPPVWVTSMLPLLVRALIGPLTPIPSIEPLPAEASNAPPTSAAAPPPGRPLPARGPAPAPAPVARAPARSRARPDGAARSPDVHRAGSGAHHEVAVDA